MYSRHDFLRIKLVTNIKFLVCAYTSSKMARMTWGSGKPCNVEPCDYSNPLSVYLNVPFKSFHFAFFQLLLCFLGIYVCCKCEHPLFSSVAKYEHQTPWPAFSTPLRSDSLSKKPESEAQDSSDCYALKVILCTSFMHFLYSSFVYF